MSSLSDTSFSHGRLGNVSSAMCRTSVCCWNVHPDRSYPRQIGSPTESGTLGFPDRTIHGFLLFKYEFVVSVTLGGRLHYCRSQAFTERKNSGFFDAIGGQVNLHKLQNDIKGLVKFWWLCPETSLCLQWVTPTVFSGNTLLRKMTDFSARSDTYTWRSSFQANSAISLFTRAYLSLSRFEWLSIYVVPALLQIT